MGDRGSMRDWTPLTPEAKAADPAVCPSLVHPGLCCKHLTGCKDTRGQMRPGCTAALGGPQHSHGRPEEPGRSAAMPAQRTAHSARRTAHGTQRTSHGTQHTAHSTQRAAQLSGRGSPGAHPLPQPPARHARMPGTRGTRPGLCRAGAGRPPRARPPPPRCPRAAGGCSRPAGVGVEVGWGGRREGSWVGAARSCCLTRVPPPPRYLQGAARGLWRLDEPALPHVT